MNTWLPIALAVGAVVWLSLLAGLAAHVGWLILGRLTRRRPYQPRARRLSSRAVSRTPPPGWQLATTAPQRPVTLADVPPPAGSLVWPPPRSWQGVEK